MKDEGLTLFAVTLDQQRSRRSEDLVPAALDLATRTLGDQVVLPPERTAGDEVQLLLADPAALVRLVEAFTRLGGWWCGVGVGMVDQPLPESTRAARGPAYLAARRAVERAERTPTGCALEVEPVPGKTVGGDEYLGGMESSSALPQLATDAEAALWLQQSLLSHRTAEGWEVTDLLEGGLGVAQAAARLGISASAVSQRHQRAGLELSRRGRELCTGLLAGLQQAVGAAA